MVDCPISTQTPPIPVKPIRGAMGVRRPDNHLTTALARAQDASESLECMGAARGAPEIIGLGDAFTVYNAHAFT
jgi:hypothetical protein